VVHNNVAVNVASSTSISETIRKASLVKAQTALKNEKKIKKLAKNDFQYGGWNYVAGGSEMTCH